MIQLSSRLIVKGPIYADIDDFKKFIDTLDKYRSEKCVRVVSFQGTTATDEFKWCASDPCPNEATDPRECAFRT